MRLSLPCRSFLSPRYPPFFSLRALTLNEIGVPSKLNASRIWFSKKRSKLMLLDLAAGEEDKGRRGYYGFRHREDADLFR
jgi:hypothetical protein